ncbi:hypothetical protein M404DRAFT_999668 [Pisolithus tinctorius Marx 270]|uniref:Uncharacterized protein n=1 Tax=Pisolithus tinctorius Marx 270 TaxID=870435 RepID=A0A0C3K8P4_PISTI|nr:hypothetical protein M404DRAFT_999668 [Pisolithus tinctorius Marx 270]
MSSSSASCSSSSSVVWSVAWSASISCTEEGTPAFLRCREVSYRTTEGGTNRVVSSGVHLTCLPRTRTQGKQG